MDFSTALIAAVLFTGGVISMSAALDLKHIRTRRHPAMERAALIISILVTVWLWGIGIWLIAKSR